MVFWKIKKQLNLEDLQNHLKELNKIETQIWEMHKNNQSEELIQTAQKREHEVRPLSIALSKIIEDEKAMSQVENKKELQELDEEMKKLLNHLTKQVELLSEIIDKNNELKDEENAITGNKTNEHESETTTKFRELDNMFSNLSEKIITINHDLENKVHLLAEEQQTTTMNGRFIVKQDTIYDAKTKITWDRDLTKSGQMSWINAEKYAEQNRKQLPTREDFWNLTNEIGSWKADIEKGYPLESDMKKIGFIIVNKEYYQWTIDKFNEHGLFHWMVNFNDKDITTDSLKGGYACACCISYFF